MNREEFLCLFPFLSVAAPIQDFKARIWEAPSTDLQPACKGRSMGTTAARPPGRLPFRRCEEDNCRERRQWGSGLAKRVSMPSRPAIVVHQGQEDCVLQFVAARRGLAGLAG